MVHDWERHWRAPDSASKVNLVMIDADPEGVKQRRCELLPVEFPEELRNAPVVRSNGISDLARRGVSRSASVIRGLIRDRPGWESRIRTRQKS